MSDQITITRTPVTIVDGVLRIRSLQEPDPEVVSFVEGSDDQEAAVHRMMQIGARAIPAIEIAMVETAVSGMTTEFAGALDTTITQITGITDGLLDHSNGALPKALQTFSEQLDKLLGDAFDADSKQSIIGKFEQLFTDAAKAQVEAVRRVVDPDNADSPLARHRAEIIKVVKETEDKMTKAVADVSEKIAVSKAQAQLIEKTSGKGFTFEELVHTTISGVAAAHCDIAEHVGRKAGAGGNQAGDEVVTLCLDDTRGMTAKYVLELKDRKLGLNAAFQELERAMANREAEVGIAVFSRQEHAPVPGPFHFWGNYAIVVLDKDTVDNGALRLACLWARWMVRRQLGDDATDVNIDRIGGLIDDARRALDRTSTVRRYHTQARKCIEQATGQVSDMTSDIEIILDAIATEIGQ